jgi:hypothetical protein
LIGPSPEPGLISLKLGEQHKAQLQNWTENAMSKFQGKNVLGAKLELVCKKIQGKILKGRVEYKNPIGRVSQCICCISWRSCLKPQHRQNLV